MVDGIKRPEAAPLDFCDVTKAKFGGSTEY